MTCSDWRPCLPDFMERVAESGKFVVKASPGKYYLADRPGERLSGPPRPDEKIFWARGAKGGLQVFTLQAGGGSLDVGVIAGSPENASGDLTFQTIPCHRN